MKCSLSLLALGFTVAGLTGCPAATTPNDASTSDAQRDAANATDAIANDVPELIDSAVDATTTDSSENDASAVDASAVDVVDAGSLADAATPRCPASLPSSGTRCESDSLYCVYGTDPRRSCRSSATCSGGVWEVIAPRCVPNVCPNTEPSGSCTDEGSVCEYGAGTRCTCTGCFGGPCSPNLRWICQPPPAATGCPSRMPNPGESCPTAGLSCDYGGCLEGFFLQCNASNVWVTQRSICPL